MKVIIMNSETWASIRLLWSFVRIIKSIKNIFDVKRQTTIFKTGELLSKIEHPVGCIPSSDKDAFIDIMEESEKDKNFHKIKQKGKDLSIKDKKKIIDFYNIQKQSRSKISQLLNIPYSTIWRVVKDGYSQFEEDKNIENDANSYTKLNSTLKQKIEN